MTAIIHRNSVVECLGYACSLLYIWSKQSAAPLSLYGAKMSSVVIRIARACGSVRLNSRYDDPSKFSILDVHFPAGSHRRKSLQPRVDSTLNHSRKMRCPTFHDRFGNNRD